MECERTNNCPGESSSTDAAMETGIITDLSSTAGTGGMTGVDSEGPTGRECGNEVVEVGEHCDDGNTLDGDGCPGSCVYPSGTVVWQRDVDVGRMGHNDFVEGVGVDAVGNIYVIGSVMVTPGEARIFLQKLDAAGNKLWLQQIVGPTLVGPHHGSAIWVDPEGSVFATGRLYISGSLENQDKREHVWVGKYDRDGRQIWETILEEDNVVTEPMPSQIVRFDDGVGIVGTRNAMDGSVLKGVVGFWVELSEEGQLHRQHELASALEAAHTLSPSLVVMDAELSLDGHILVTGYLRTREHWFDAWVAKMTREGQWLWEWSYDGGGGDWDVFHEVEVSAKGEVFAAGKHRLENGGQDHLLVAKLSGEGALIWTQSYSGPGGRGDVAQGLAVDGEGHAYVHGTSRDDRDAQDLNNSEMWLRAYNEEGNERWTSLFTGLDVSTGHSWDVASNVVLDREKFVVAVGSSIISAEAPYYDVLIRKLAQ